MESVKRRERPRIWWGGSRIWRRHKVQQVLETIHLAELYNIQRPASKHFNRRGGGRFPLLLLSIRTKTKKVLKLGTQKGSTKNLQTLTSRLEQQAASPRSGTLYFNLLYSRPGELNHPLWTEPGNKSWLERNGLFSLNSVTNINNP